MATSRLVGWGWPVLAVFAIHLSLLAGWAAVNAADPQPEPTRQIVVRLSRDVFAPLVENEVDRTTDVTDVILGTSVRGRARTRGMPQLDLVPDQNRASFVVTLRGTNVSRTTGRNGPAIVYTRADTQFVATKRITFEAGKGFVAQPALIRAETRTTTEGVGATRRGFIGRIVRRRAWRRVNATRPQVDAIARQKAESRIRAAFDQSVAAKLARVNQSTDLRTAAAILLGGEMEPRFASTTTRQYLQIVAWSGEGPAPAFAAPKLSGPAAPVQLWVHQSIFGETTANALKLLEQAPALNSIAGKALAIVPAILKQFGSQQQPGLSPTLDYQAAGDWVVMQVGSDALARIAGGALGPGLAPTQPPVRAAVDRRWTSVDGRFTCMAGLVSATRDSVKLKRARDGKVITVPLWRLSELDQQIARRAAG